MKQVDVSRIALGACNMSVARGQANGLHFAGLAAETVVDIICRQLSEKRISLNVPDAKTGTVAALRTRIRDRVLATLQHADDSLKEAALPPRFGDKLDRVRAEIGRDGYEPEVVSKMIEEYVYDIIAELVEPTFLRIDREKRALWELPTPGFGLEVDNAFPDAKRDVAAACRCFALDEWTASVFHCMRVLEHGLQKMALRFNVPIERESWHKVIKGVEDGIDGLRNKQGPTELERREVTYYSGAASQFRHFKDAWRNHVAHAREHYDEREAETVMTHVRELMQHLANQV